MAQIEEKQEPCKISAETPSRPVEGLPLNGYKIKQKSSYVSQTIEQSLDIAHY